MTLSPSLQDRTCENSEKTFLVKAPIMPSPHFPKPTNQSRQVSNCTIKHFSGSKNVLILDFTLLEVSDRREEEMGISTRETRDQIRLPERTKALTEAGHRM